MVAEGGRVHDVVFAGGRLGAFGRVIGGQRPSYLLAGALAVLAGIAVGTGTADPVLPLLACWLPVALLGVFGGRRLQIPALSPVWIVMVMVALVGSLGFLLQSGLNGAPGGGVALSLSASDIIRTTWLFAAFSGSLGVGVAVTALARSRPKPVPRFHLPAMNSRARLACLVLSAAPAATIIIGVGAQLLARNQYLTSVEGTSFVSIAVEVGVGAVAVCGYLYGLEHGARRAFALVIAAAYLMVFFAMGSRQLTMVPLGFAVGLFATQTGRKGRVWTVLVGLVAMFLLLPIPLYLRGQQFHGLLAHLSYMQSFSYGSVDWIGTLNNVLIAFPIAGKTAFEVSRLPLGYLWIELNPLPGTMAGWYQITSSMLLNPWTPYSAIGELGNYGLLAVFLVGLGIGAVLAYLDGRVGAYLCQGRSLVSAAIVGCVLLFSVTILQYSLRTSLRIMVYILIADLAMRLVFRRPIEDGVSADPPGVETR